MAKTPYCYTEKEYLAINLKKFPLNELVKVIWYDVFYIFRKNKHTLIITKNELTKDKKGNIIMKEDK